MVLKKADYNRARKWVKKNIDASKFVSLEEFLDEVMGSEGFSKVKKAGKLRDQVSIGQDFVFEKSSEFTDFVQKQKEELEAERRTLEVRERLLNDLRSGGRAPSTLEVEVLQGKRKATKESLSNILSEFGVGMVGKEAPRTAPASVVQERPKGFFQRVRNFFGGLFK